MNPIYNIIVYLVWFLATYYTVFFSLSIILNKKKIFEGKSGKADQFVSVLVPAYNEESSIAETIRSLKKLSHKAIEFIIISDGSTDKTSEIVNKSIKGDSRFKFIDRKENRGKAGSLNQGIEEAKGEFIACMDADSIIEKNIFSKVLPYFSEKNVGAVTVSVEVLNPKNLLHRIFALEFNLGLSLFLKIFSFFDCVFVTPGPFSMYRKDMLEKIGGFDVNNITEDHEIAFRIHKSGYKIKNCIEAKVFTELPEDFKGLYVQRRRWYSGAIQTFFKHRDMLFSSKYGLFGYFMPFNFSLIFIGLGLFAASTYLWLSKSLEGLLYFRYTNFNFFEHLKFSFDILEYGRVNLLGLTMFSATILLMVIGIIYTRKKFSSNRVGLLGYPFLFFLYQIYWGGALLAVLRGRKIKWR